MRAPGKSVAGSSTTNSSPPSRASTSIGRRCGGMLQSLASATRIASEDGELYYAPD